jgi:hypothetical protein
VKFQVSYRSGFTDLLPPLVAEIVSKQFFLPNIRTKKYYNTFRQKCKLKKRSGRDIPGASGSSIFVDSRLPGNDIWGLFENFVVGMGCESFIIDYLFPAFRDLRY